MGYLFGIITKAFLIKAIMVGLVCSQETSKPNIVLIYTDDQGWGDVSAWNSESKFQTPNLDKLAAEGVSFKHGHSPDSICSPSRYGILTGRYPWRTTIKGGNPKVDGPCMIEDGTMTLASLLQEQGYNTAIVGKWHLGMQVPGSVGKRDWTKPIEDMPLDKGFDYFYGIPGSMNYGVMAWFEGRYAKVPPTKYTNRKKNTYHPECYRIMPPYRDGSVISTDSTRQVKRGLEVASDFIDNLALTKFTEKAVEWMGSKVEEAKNGKPFFLYLPYTSPHYPVCPLPEFHGKGAAGPYGEFMIETDHHVGTIMKFLEENDLDENTMIIYTSDNGPEKSWVKRLKDYGHDSRGGLRSGKRSNYEGGHRVPFIVRWPKGIKEPGRDWNKPVGQTDLLATFAELTGGELKPQDGVDSQSFAKVLVDPTYDYSRAPLLCKSVGDVYCITEGSWKLHAGKEGIELYNLDDDLAETKNLVKEHSEKAEELLHKFKSVIAEGRSTEGPTQSNDTGHWEQLESWFTETEYNKLAQ